MRDEYEFDYSQAKPNRFRRPMKLRKVISGGQTGADRTALECAYALGLQTGGTVPKGCRTDEGPDLSLLAFGCVESSSASYPPRTRANVRDSEATVWFGDTRSPGAVLTKHACDEYGKSFIPNPPDLREVAEKYAVINVAGNRKSKNPGVVEQVRAAFRPLAQAGRLPAHATTLD